MVAVKATIIRTEISCLAMGHTIYKEYTVSCLDSSRWDKFQESANLKVLQGLREDPFRKDKKIKIIISCRGIALVSGTGSKAQMDL